MTMQKVSPSSSSPVDVSDIATKMNIWPANMGILTDSLRVLQKPNVLQIFTLFLYSTQIPRYTHYEIQVHLMNVFPKLNVHCT